MDHQVTLVLIDRACRLTSKTSAVVPRTVRGAHLHLTHVTILP